MNRTFVVFAILSAFLVNSCELVQDNKAETLMLPTNMTATVIMGSHNTKVVADFHYLPESDLLDHITWSNHQTHYFDYNASGQLLVLRQLKVLEKVQDEFWFAYEGERISKVLLVRKNLDYTYLEPVDSIYQGHIDYEYEGKQVIRETEYHVILGGSGEYPVREASFSYDADGNILSSFITYAEGHGQDESLQMTYDSGKHPFSGLAFYFTGESFVNNQLTRNIGMEEYSYDVRLNEQEYPEAIYEKLGSLNTRIIRYTYMKR